MHWLPSAILIFIATFLVHSDARIDSIFQAAPRSSDAHARKFEVDWMNDTFRMDGRPFQFVGGSFHYFRAHPGSWRRLLRSMRAGGLNVVTTYVEWALHNPHDGEYNWSGFGNLTRFIELAVEEDFYVILRPGPYICAERDMGGFPYWLLTKYPNIKLRTYDRNYLIEVSKWYDVLMKKLEKYLYGNGGPIIMVQVENEYGSFGVKDEQYKQWLRNLTEYYVKDKAVLFTNDGPSQTPRGYMPGVLATLDFGAANEEQVRSFWSTLRHYQPRGPLVNIEYYPGWLTHWQEPMQRVQTEPVARTLRHMLSDGASVNFYMYYGGTNFGFTAGANDGGPGSYNVDVTSYDYDAPLDECGDITSKYLTLRDVIGEFFPLPQMPIPKRLPKTKFGPVQVRPMLVMISNQGRRKMGSPPVNSIDPMSFEALNQFSGFVLYETRLPKTNRDPAVLTVNKLRDRAYVYIDRNFIGILSRENAIYSLPIPLGLGKKLQILVENQGRINYNIPNDFKGILGEVTYNGENLRGWTMTGFPLEDIESIENEMRSYMNQPRLVPLSHGKNFVKSGPTFFYGTFNLTADQHMDTYLNPLGWGKGVVLINGFNLGRYWPLVGPQITLYVPKEVLKVGMNEITLLELQKAAEFSSVTFTDQASLDGDNSI